jgi:hypothetical protein
MKTQTEIKQRVELLERVVAEMVDPKAISCMKDEIKFLKKMLDTNNNH